MSGAGVAAERLKAAAFELDPDPVLILSAEGALLAANEAAQGLLGRTLASWDSQAGAATPSVSLERLIARALALDAPTRDRAFELRLPGQPTLAIDAVCAPLEARTVRLSLRRRDDEQPDEFAGLRSAEGLARMLAHEIKNPLSGMRGAAQLLESGLPSSDLPLARLIIDEADRIARLIDRVTAFSDERAPERRPVNIHQVLDRVRALAASGLAEGAALREAFDPSLPPALGDEDQLIQLFLNLVKNAAEAIAERGDDHGEIVLSTAWRQGLKVRSGEGFSEAPLEVRIADNGPGCPPNLRGHLFEPFVTTKADGAGLGLAVCARIAAAHGGLIEFDSEPGRTVVRVHLPVAPRCAKEPA
ncbi:MAG: two-component system sensor histidine kinase NtrB [Caulobacteraceae bacterium]